MRISDWSSDVCSSDLLGHAAADRRLHHVLGAVDVGAHAFERVVLGDRHMLQRRRVHHVVDPAHRHLQPVDVAHVDRLAMAMRGRSEEHTSELQSLMRISYAVICLTKKNNTANKTSN